MSPKSPKPGSDRRTALLVISPSSRQVMGDLDPALEPPGTAGIEVIRANGALGMTVAADAEIDHGRLDLVTWRRAASGS